MYRMYFGAQAVMVLARFVSLFVLMLTLDDFDVLCSLRPETFPIFSKRNAPDYVPTNVLVNVSFLRN